MARPKTRTKSGPDTRKSVKVDDPTHRYLKVLAALDGISIEAAFERYGGPAVAKAFEAKTAPTK